MTGFRSFLLLTATVAAACPAFAQDADIAPPAEAVMVTATRVPTPVDDIAAGVTVIDRATIEARGYTTLADALSAVAGVHVVQSGGLGENASLFVRGADSDQVQVLVDGVPVNDASGPGGAYNFGVETLADVARIEVVRGPMSAVYGSGAIGGVVNIITQRGERQTHASLVLAAGAPAALLGQADLRGAFGAFDYNLSAESRSDRGSDATPERESVFTGERDGYRSRTGGVDLGYTPVAGTRVFVDVRGRTAVYGYDDVGYPAFDDPNETGRDNDTFGRAGVDSTLFGGVWQTGLSGSFDQEYRHYTNLLDADDPDQAAEDSRYLGRRRDVQWNNTVHLPDMGVLSGNTVTAGYEHNVARAGERLDLANFGSPFIQQVNATDRRDSGYFGAQGKLAERLALSANVREEAVSGVRGAATWRVGGSYALPWLGAHLKASYGTAFLAPSLFDRYGVDNFGYVGNPDLRPERSHGYEIGWTGDVWKGGGRTRAAVEVTWFHTRVHDLIQTEFAPVYTSVNVAAARLQGVETALHLHPLPWMDADVVYTYTDARDVGTGMLLLRRPYHSGAVTLAVRPVPALSIVPELDFAGGDLDALVNNQGYPVGDGLKEGGVIANLNVAYRLMPHVGFFAWGKNLADSHYEAASGFATPGPSFLAGVQLTE